MKRVPGASEPRRQRFERQYQQQQYRSAGCMAAHVGWCDSWRPPAKQSRISNLAVQAAHACQDPAASPQHRVAKIVKAATNPHWRPMQVTTEQTTAVVCHSTRTSLYKELNICIRQLNTLDSHSYTASGQVQHPDNNPHSRVGDTLSGCHTCHLPTSRWYLIVVLD